MKFIHFTLLFLLISVSQALSAKPSFEQYLADLKLQAIEQGYSTEFVDQVFAGVSYRKKTVTADKNQPETKLTLDKYLATRVPDWKVKKAVDLMAQHKVLLDQVEQKFGVQKRFIVALWGNESNFGNIMGKHSVINSLVTLAYDGRRETLFKKQLFAALKILQQRHIELQHLVGSWAGAMGQSQFMPTSFLDYAIDFDNDGRKDIWNNQADVFASIANFLKSEGWSNQITWGRQVKVPDNFDFSLAGLKSNSKRLLADWQAMEVRRYDGGDLPDLAIKASLIAPDGENGRIYLVYENFHTLMKWNRSSYFGISVSYLADRIKKGS
ncbi:lytic murein transglycosylase [Paraglaciecola arctica]|uniref:Membrane-bound lytic murein transglycosylase B n=1 Tax=Paraglaciecola arctica BSs20135 TaxID=493475 RepID=K6XID8_9ALTE|nr:lytic murein transglycosylase [Paraglaciecola arctica]GAC20409.1 membrane-bound lytic murein transglycosylase B [Paraglaciecola arctica BSs20135]